MEYGGILRNIVEYPMTSAILDKCYCIILENPEESSMEYRGTFQLEVSPEIMVLDAVPGPIFWHNNRQLSTISPF